MGKLFVWDFHGTLEQGNDNAVLAVTNEVLEKFKYARRMTLAEAEKLAGLKWREYFAFLLPETSADIHIELEGACREITQMRFDTIRRYIRPNDHAHEILEEISERHEQIVISNTSPSGLQLYLDATGMLRFFPDGHAFGTHGLNGKSITKHEALEGFLQQRAADHIIAIGDSAHDLIGTVNYLYAHPGRSFRECTANYKINDLRKVRKEI